MPARFYGAACAWRAGCGRKPATAPPAHVRAPSKKRCGQAISPSCRYSPAREHRRRRRRHRRCCCCRPPPPLAKLVGSARSLVTSPPQLAVPTALAAPRRASEGARTTHAPSAAARHLQWHLVVKARTISVEDQGRVCYERGAPHSRGAGQRLGTLAAIAGTLYLCASRLTRRKSGSARAREVGRTRTCTFLKIADRNFSMSGVKANLTTASCA